MPIKLDIGEPSSKKTFHVEASLEPFLGKKLGDKIQGTSIKEFPFEGYEFEITGASHMAGFPVIKGIPGSGLKRVLLTHGQGLKKKPRKEGKKMRGYQNPKGLRMKRTIHANLITESIMQVNLKVIKSGSQTMAKILGKEEVPKEEKTEAPAN
jgi:small subunit ribosomal protein S6e